MGNRRTPYSVVSTPNISQQKPKKRSLSDCYSRTTEMLTTLPYQGHGHDEEHALPLDNNKGCDSVTGFFNTKKLLKTGLLESLKVRYVSGQGVDLPGIIQGTGVLCGCPVCNFTKLVNLSTFEQHAGARAKRPADHIYIEELSFTLSVFVQRIKSRQIDQIREEIHDMLLCKGSSQVVNLQKKMHRIGMDDSALLKKKKRKHVPKEEEPSAKERQRKDGNCDEGDVIDEDDRCALCDDPHFCTDGFTDQRVVFCDQCGKQYHVGCLRSSQMANLKEAPQGNSFCQERCRVFYDRMQHIVRTGTRYLEDEVYQKLAIRSQFEDNHGPCQCEVTWEIVHGNDKDERSRMLIGESKSLFEAGFSPIVDPLTKQELIPCMLNCSPDHKKNLQGMFCAVLCVNSEAVSSAVFRVFGEDVAELPLVATAFKSRGKGYFDTLYTCLEGLLKRLHVKKLVLPAAVEVESMWKNRFGFSDMNTKEVLRCPMMTFSGTKTLEKNL